jgi:plastocyanin
MALPARMGKNSGMKMTATASLRRRLGLPVAAALLFAGCAGGEGPGWTFAPLGPTQSPGGSPGGSPAANPGGSPGASPGGSPAGSPAGSPGTGTLLRVTTTAANQLAFEPNQLTAPPATEITVEYLNDSPVLHNIHFFAGPDASAPPLAATAQVTGPGALESVTFTTPAESGQYFFHCDIHPPNMTGTLSVSP